VLNFNPAYPVTTSEADQTLTRLYHAKFNLWFIDPITGRGYPQDAWQDYGEDAPEIQAGDMETMTAPLDFLGVNYYSWHLCYDRAGSQGYPIIRRPNPVNMMARGWQNVPHALKDLMTWLHTDYAFPALYITENGATYDDVLWEGRVHDLARLDYLRDHIAILPGLIESGIRLKGYFYWSLLDNFEWATGTRDRFGLAHTDFATQKRTLKDSGYWYGRLTRANALVD
jgi:beta-glucosidase